MAGRRVVTMGAPPGANGEGLALVDAYLIELRSRLRGPTRLRARVVEEIGSDLESAVIRLESHGYSRFDASRVAIEDLGSVESIADGLADELAIAQSRRIVNLLLLTGPLVGVWWLLLLAPHDWAAHPGELIAAIPVLPVIAVAVAIGALALARTGSLIRWIPEARSQRAAAMAASVGFACVAGDLVALSILAIRVSSGTASSLPVAIAIVAVAASLTRLPFTIRACASILGTGRRLHSGGSASD